MEGFWAQGQKAQPLCHIFGGTLWGEAHQGSWHSIARQEILRFGNHIWLPAIGEVIDEKIVNLFLKMTCWPVSNYWKYRGHSKSGRRAVNTPAGLKLWKSPNNHHQFKVSPSLVLKATLEAKSEEDRSCKIIRPLIHFTLQEARSGESGASDMVL